MSCISASDSGASSGQTAAGFPVNGRSAKASTWNSGSVGMALRLYPIRLARERAGERGASALRSAAGVARLEERNPSVDAGRAPPAPRSATPRPAGRRPAPRASPAGDPRCGRRAGRATVERRRRRRPARPAARCAPRSRAGEGRRAGGARASRSAASSGPAPMITTSARSPTASSNRSNPLMGTNRPTATTVGSRQTETAARRRPRVGGHAGRTAPRRASGARPARRVRARQRGKAALQVLAHEHELGARVGEVARHRAAQPNGRRSSSATSPECAKARWGSAARAAATPPARTGPASG